MIYQMKFCMRMNLMNLAVLGIKCLDILHLLKKTPRSSEKYDDYILLLQIDSVGIGDKEIMLGG